MISSTTGFSAKLDSLANNYFLNVQSTSHNASAFGLNIKVTS